MVAYTGFQGWVGYLGLAAINLNTDQIRVFLTNSAPSASLDDVYTDLTDLTTTGGYTARGEDILNGYTETTGTGTCTATDVTWNATGGGFGPFQYVVAFDETATVPADPLIGWWDHGSALTLIAGESFTVDFVGDTLLTIT